MKFRSTLILLLLATGVGAYIWFVELNHLSTKDAKDRAQLVLQVDRADINAISIKNTETRIELRKKSDGLWHLEEPVKDRADPMMIHQLFTLAESLRHERVLGAPGKGPEKSQLKEFGISNSEVRFKLSGSEKPVELILGKDTGLEGKIYTKIDGSDPVYVIASDLKSLITRKTDDFRDHRLTALSPAQVHKVTVKSAFGEIELQKIHDHWTLVKPLNARGDDSKIGDFIAQAATTRIDTFVADSANLAAYGLQEPRGTVSFYSDDAEAPVVLQIGAKAKSEALPDKPEKQNTYAKLSTRDSVVLLPKSIEQLLETKPNDLRDKLLARVEPDIVDRITIEPADREKIVLARRGESWVRKAKSDLAINAAAASKLLSAFKDQQVTKFVTDIASDLPKYGLDRPRLKLTFSSFASENTAETSAGEKPIATVLFGKEEGGLVYAKLDDEPFIVSLEKSVVDSIATDPIRWQPLNVYQFKPEEITAFEITRVGQPPVALERDKDKWKLAKGDGSINQINAQSLVNTLASLHAVRWSGPVLPDFGLDQPALSVTFKTSSNLSGKLALGLQSVDQMTHATVAGTNGAFELSRPDRDALELPLLDKPVPVPPPAAVTPTQPAQPTP